MALLDEGPVRLDTPEKLFVVLRELVGEDGLTWRGGVTGWGEENPAGPARWRIELNDNKGNQVSAGLGDRLVLTYGRLLVLDEGDE